MKEQDCPEKERLLLEELARKLEEDDAIYVDANGALVVKNSQEEAREAPLTLSKPRQIWY